MSTQLDPLAVPAEESDPWRRPISPSVKPVIFDNEKCSQSVKDIFALSKNVLKDPYSEDETELRFLYSKPTCFLFLGKPGVGKTALARRFCAEWKCELINSTDVIMQNMELQTDMGLKCADILTRGEAVPDDMVLRMIEEKVNSPEVSHHGYLIDDFPCLSEEFMSVKDQLELVKSWKFAPDFVINIRMPDKDIEKRRIGQKIDPLTGEIHIKEVYAPDHPLPPPSPDKDEEEEEEEEEAEDEEETLEDEEPLVELPTEVLERLIKRPEDLSVQVVENLEKYKINSLRILEDYMADHDQQYLVEMDGNQTILTLFKQLMQKLLTFVLRPAAVVTRIIDPDDDELPEEIETEELLRTLGPKLMVAPRYRWRRSRWLRHCPVALYEGNIIQGKPEFAVSFLDKMYCLSSAEALEKFVKNPRPYLLPQQPRPPCKLSILGPPLSGKTTLSNLMAHKYGGKVFDTEAIFKVKKEEEKQKLFAQIRADTTDGAIQVVKVRIKERLEWEASENERMRLQDIAQAAAKEQEERDRLEALINTEAERDGEGGEEGNGPEPNIEGDENENKPMEAEDTVDQQPSASKEGLASQEGQETPEGQETSAEGEDVLNGEENGDENKSQKEEGDETAENELDESEPKAGEAEPVVDEVPVEAVPSVPEIPEPYVDATHPEVEAIVAKTIAEAENQQITLTAEVQVEVLEIAIKAWEKQLRSKNIDGPLFGCWILDNYPRTREQWNAMLEKNLLPDDVIILGNSEGGESREISLFKRIAERYALSHRQFLFNMIDQREQDRLQTEEAERIAETARQRKAQKDLIMKRLEALGFDIFKLAHSGFLDNMTLEELLAFKPKSLGEEFKIKDADELVGVQNPECEGKSTLAEGLDEEDDTHTGNEGDSSGSKSAGKSGQAARDAARNDMMDEVVSPSAAEGEEEKAPTPEPEFVKSELEILMETPEVLALIEKIKESEKELANLIATITGTSSIEPLQVDAAYMTPDELQLVVIKHLERMFKYVGWEMGAADLDEEDEDLEAETLEAEEEAVDEEEVEEEEEDPNRSIKKKFLGDCNYFDPVSLRETEILVPGNPEIAAVYREKVYYFSTNENRDKFLENPISFLSNDDPMKPPPLRLLILGARGAGKSLHARHLSEKLGVFHISFRERLQELIIAKTKKKIGPEFEEEEEPEEEEEDSESEPEMDSEDDAQVPSIGEEGDEETGRAGTDRASTVLTEGISTIREEEEQKIRESEDEEGEEGKEKVEKAESSVPVPATPIASTQKQPETIPEEKPIVVVERQLEEEEEEPEFTEDEEAIKANLESNEPLPPELLETILSGWWTKEPFKSTGFILEGFPQTSDDVRYLQEAGLLPDAAIILQVSDDDVIGRLLPPKLDKWKARRDKRLAKKAHKKEKAQKKRDAAIAKRREQLMKERDETRQAKQHSKDPDESGEEEEEEEEEEEDEEDDIEAILAEEFEEEEEEEEDDEELEEDAVERMKNDFNEVYDDDTNRLTTVEETLEECLIPRLNVTAGRKPHIIRYILNKKLKPYVNFRHSMFERVYPLSERQAKRMLQVGYKHPSRFGHWDPVKLKEGHCVQPMNGPGYPTFPCFYRSHIYFMATHANRHTFMIDPMTFLKQETPKPVVPIKMAIIGPPKSGKTTLANRFVEEYGVVRMSVGEAMRQILTLQPKSDLASRMNWYLLRGRVVPDDLQICALETAMLDMRCQTRGYVLDGFPNTKRQIDLMTEHSIIPVRVIELELDGKEVMMRATKDRVNPNKGYVAHDSSQILAIKLSNYTKKIDEVRNWYREEHQNLRVVDAQQSKWYLWEAVHELATSSVKKIQNYLQRTGDGKAANIAELCITPKEFAQRVGDFNYYCPVSLADWGELVDCSINPTLEFAAEYRGHYYKMAGEKELNLFLANPEKYVPPYAPRKLPPPELLPKRIMPKDLEGREAEINGYCPVTYLDGKMRYEALKPGNPEFLVEYKGKIYIMQTEEKLFKFMKLPEKYSNLKLPHKLPPKEEDLPLTNLPMLGFMEQTSAVAMVKALTAAGNAKPKYPFISSTRSALIYIAYHLKAYNPKSSPYIRKKYKQKLKQFVETCELIKYLGNNMTVRYRDPNERPKDFDSKLESFFALRGTEPTPTWCT